MSAPLLACPHCQAPVASSRTLPGQAMLRCPDCGIHFAAPQTGVHPIITAAEDDSGGTARTPLPRSRGPALAATTLLVAALGTGIGYLARHGLPLPQDEHNVQTALDARQLQEERRRLDRERLQVQAQKQRLEHDQAAAAGRLQEQEKPAAEARRQQEQAQEALAKAQATRQKDEAEFARHMEAGKRALGTGEYTDALREALAARRVQPEDPEARWLQKQAEEGLTIQEDLQRRRVAHTELMKRGRDALARQHYDEAVQALTAALDLLPDDRPTQKALKRARTARVDARLEYGNRINRARTALRGGHFEAAQRLYAEAAHILPGDAEAQRGQNVAEDALQQSQTAFRRFMSEAGEAMAEGDYSQAVRAFREALRLTPDDPAASQGYREAVAALREAPTDPRDYERALQAGREALRQHHYAAATRAFRAALRADPDSTQAQDSLRRARYSQAVAEGQRALRGRRTTDAIAAFEEALQVIPGDPAASAFLEQARALRR